MSLYTFEMTDGNPQITVDRNARVKQFCLYGAYSTATVTASTLESNHFETVYDSFTNAALVIDMTKSTFSLVDQRVSVVAFNVEATGTYFINVDYWG